MRSLLLLLLTLLVSDAEGFFYYERRVTIDRLLQKCRTYGWPRCRSCSGRCVYGKTFGCATSPCASNPCAEDEKCVVNNCGGCNACCVKKPYCSQRPKRCPSGADIYRDPENDCQFPECPPVTCPADVQKCPDGSTVSRDPERRCEFKECRCLLPAGWTLAERNPMVWLRREATCEGGLEPWYDSECGCGCRPGGGRCPAALRRCPDGTVVVRDPERNCAFPRCECPPANWTLVGRSPWVCRRLRYRCEPGTRPWCDDVCGCGCRPVVCPEDVKTCPDGSTVARDPKKSCEFTKKCECPPGNWTLVGDPRACKGETLPACGPGFEFWNNTECGCGCRPAALPPAPIVCPTDVKTCLDNTTVSRDPENNCTFRECECPPANWTRVGDPEMCTRILFFCEPGFEHWSDTECGCGCRPAALPPAPVVCGDDVKTCLDNTTVSRDPMNNCTFPECECPPVNWTLVGNPTTCSKVLPYCAPGWGPWSSPQCGCGCKPCPTDMKTCPDGSTVSRTEYGCEFPECPPVVCPTDVKTCLDNTTVSRDPKNNCTFPECECPPANWTRVGDPELCTRILFFCEPGFEHWFDTQCGCGCRPAALPPTPVVCDDDVKTCLDNTNVSRDPMNNCTFPECECPPVNWTLVADPEKCKEVKPVCGTGYEPWNDTECGCGCKPSVPITCLADVKTCADGSTVSRDPENNCTFPACECPPANWFRFGNPEECVKSRDTFPPCIPGFEPWNHTECGCGCKPAPFPPVDCGDDVETCIDNTTVARDPRNNCDFAKCACPPTNWTLVADPETCKRNGPVCGPGYAPWSTSECGCGCRPLPPPPSPAPVVCATDVKTCLDNSTVSRDPKNNCTFPECECPPANWTLISDPTTCPLIDNLCRASSGGIERCKRVLYNCPPGYETWGGSASESECGCGCRPPAPVVCTNDVKECPDGSYVSRVAPNCEFPECPDTDDVVCAADVRQCHDGTFVSRDPKNGCAFRECPNKKP